MNQDGTLSDSHVDLAKDIVAETGAAYVHLLPSQDLYGLLSQATSVPTTLFGVSLLLLLYLPAWRHLRLF